MKIVVLERDTVGEDIDFGGLEEFGDVALYPLSTKEEARERVRGADIVVANKVLMNEETLCDAERVKLICLAATGTNNIDREYVKKRGITVMNVAGYSTDAVAQHTFAMLFYLWEGLSYYDHYVKSGEYIKSPFFCHFSYPFAELKGKTYGIIGLGAIGREVARIAAAFGCRVIYYSTSGRNQNADYERVTLDELLGQSDVVSIHAPLNETTDNLMTKEQFRKMKPAAVLLNLGRGSIVNEEDLVWALENGEIRAAGLDVIREEPMKPDCPLRKIQDSTRLLVTPHIGWAPVEVRQRAVDEVCKNIRSFLNGTPRNVVV